MELVELGALCLWTGVFATGLAVLLTAPPRHLFGTFCCAIAGRLARDLLVSGGMTLNWATVIAAAVVALVAAAVLRERETSPVVLVCGVLPLGAAVAIFKTIVTIMRISSLEGEARLEASAVLASSMSQVFTISLAIALGLGAAVSLVRVVRRRPASGAPGVSNA